MASNVASGGSEQLWDVTWIARFLGQLCTPCYNILNSITLDDLKQAAKEEAEGIPFSNHTMNLLRKKNESGSRKGDGI